MQAARRRWQMPFASSRGYGSAKLQHDVAEMLNRRHAVTGQRPLVLFISDLDPSGLDLERAWQDDAGRLRCSRQRRHGCLFPAHRPDRAAGEAHDLDRFGIAVKPSDSRAESYIEEYGTTCWEADVLPAAVIEAAIDAAIEERLDDAIWNQRDREIERARDLL